MAHSNPTEPSPDDITQEIRPLDDDLPEQQPITPAEVYSSRPAAASIQPPRRTFLGRLGHALYNRETRLGRFMRSAVSTILTVIVLFAVWTAAAYYLIYAPLTQELAASRAEATQAAAALEQARQNLTLAQQEALAAETQAEQDRDRLAVSQAHIELLRAVNQVSAARLALANDDPRAANQTLLEAERTLSRVYPVLSRADSRQVDTLKALFTLARNDLDRDAALANQDLDRLQSELNRAERNILSTGQ